MHPNMYYLQICLIISLYKEDHFQIERNSGYKLAGALTTLRWYISSKLGAALKCGQMQNNICKDTLGESVA